MRLGYACKTDQIVDTNIRSCILKNASEEKIRELIHHNLWALENILRYNIEHQIPLFRISSDIIPFASLPVNTIAWWEEFQEDFLRIGSLAKTNTLRLSMHPGQYTIINSPRSDVVQKAIDDLVYHALVLESLGLDSTSKMVLHIGGVYGDKESAKKRFINTFYTLPDIVKKHLVLEHDDRLFHVQDVLEIAKECHIPVIFDNLHNEILPFQDSHLHEMEWLMKCRDTWNTYDGEQKIHYANQAPGKRIGAHADTIDEHRFFSFTHKLPIDNIDIMLEVKDKNASVERLLHLQKEKRD